MERLTHAEQARVTFRWEGQPVEARAGDSVAGALYAAGVRAIGRSRKFHRPRGLSGAFVDGVLGRVDGVPNVRLDAVDVRDGLEVRAQNVWPNQGLDLLRLARLIPRRLLRAGFEHPAWLPSGTPPFEAWERALRFLAGGARAPDSGVRRRELPGARVAVDVAVVGGGPAGRAAAIAAAAAGKSVALLSRGLKPGAFAAAWGAPLPPLPEGVRVVPNCVAFGLYRAGRLLLAAPRDGGPALAIEAERVVLATGRRSVPPLVPGADLPGVLDLATALNLAHDQGIAPGRRVVVIGRGDLGPVARRLADLGVDVVATVPVDRVRRIVGWNAVRAVVADRRIACDAVVHAGPWRPDPALPFQARVGGALRLQSTGLPDHVSVVGSAAAPPEDVSVGAGLDDAALVCPCMDVTVAEVRAHVAAGDTHVEVIKRLTGCGMGPCQGVPCWDLLAATIASLTGTVAEAHGHPTYRPPRGAITLAQAAGLADLVRPEP